MVLLQGCFHALLKGWGGGGGGGVHRGVQTKRLCFSSSINEILFFFLSLLWGIGGSREGGGGAVATPTCGKGIVFDLLLLLTVNHTHS